MKANKLSIRIILIILTSSFSTAFAQRNYFYGAFQIPAVTTIEGLVRSESDIELEEPGKFGMTLNLGYGINLNRKLTMEVGAEYFLYSPRKAYYDYSIDNSYYSDQLHIVHHAISLQFRPVYSIPVEEDVSLKIGLGVNYQKITSISDYYSYIERETDYRLVGSYGNKTKTDFTINLQPSAGIFFDLSRRWTIGMDLTYVHVNWNNTLKFIRFKEMPDLNIRNDKTSTVYAGIKVLFW